MQNRSNIFVSGAMRQSKFTRETISPEAAEAPPRILGCPAAITAVLKEDDAKERDCRNRDTGAVAAQVEVCLQRPVQLSTCPSSPSRTAISSGDEASRDQDGMRCTAFTPVTVASSNTDEEEGARSGHTPQRLESPHFSRDRGDSVTAAFRLPSMLPSRATRAKHMGSPVPLRALFSCDYAKWAAAPGETVVIRGEGGGMGGANTSQTTLPGLTPRVDSSSNASTSVLFSCGGSLAHLSYRSPLSYIISSSERVSPSANPLPPKEYTEAELRAIGRLERGVRQSMYDNANGVRSPHSVQQKNDAAMKALRFLTAP